MLFEIKTLDSLLQATLRGLIGRIVGDVSMSGAGLCILPFGVHNLQVGLRGIRYRTLPNWVSVSHVRGLFLLAEAFLEPGRLACNS